MSLIRTTALPLADQKALWRAASILERESFIARLSEITGEPVTQLLRRLPSAVTRQINQAVQSALRKSLEVALYKMDSGLPQPGNSVFKVMSGITGGLSGFFGLGALTVELPVTTTLMLRSIAGIAQRHGEDLTQSAARLACLEVFAIGPSDRDSRRGPTSETGYFAIRAFLAKAVSQAADVLAERGIAQTSSPVIVELITAVGSRFGLVVSEKVAAGAIPIIGAIGGATVNLAFMDHFQKLADAHFAIRRLERLYGQPEVIRLFEAYSPLVKQRIAESRSKDRLFTSTLAHISKRL